MGSHQAAGRVCWCCLAADLSTTLCSRCRKARYCSTTCQKTHWPVHRQECREQGIPAPFEDVRVSFMFSGCRRSVDRAGCSAVGTDVTGYTCFTESRPLGSISSRESAIYQGLILGLRSALRKYIGFTASHVHLTACGDSQLVIKQMQGKVTVSSPELEVYHHVAKGLARHFASVTFMLVPRDSNSAARQLATSRSLVGSLQPEEYVIFYPSLCDALAGGVQVDDGPTIHVSHDIGAAARYPHVLIDASFLQSLRGMQALRSLADPGPRTVVTGKVSMSVLGELRQQTKIRAMRSGHVCEIDRMIVVDKLPVPMHLPSSVPEIADLINSIPDAKRLGSGKKFEAGTFPDTYQAHEYWSSNTIMLPPSLVKH